MPKLFTRLALGIAAHCMLLSWSFAQPGALDLSFNPGTGANASVLGVLVQADGRTVIAGSFTQYNGQPANRIARLNPDGSLDGSFSSGTGFNDAVFRIAAQSDGKLVVAGNFTSYNGSALSAKLARLHPDGTLDLSFSPPALGATNVNAIHVMADDRIVLGLSGPWPSRVVRLHPDGSADASFSTLGAINGTVTAIAVHADGRALIAGTFTMVHGQSRPGLARLQADGSLDAGFDPGAGPTAPPGPSPIQAMVIRPTGEAVVAGALAAYDGQPVGRIVQLTEAGAIDGGFNTGTGFNSTVNRLRLTPDGLLWCMGEFTMVDGEPADRLCRILASGARDASFTSFPGANSSTTDIQLHNGRVYVGGAFTFYAGQPRSRIVRLFNCTPTAWYADSDGDGSGNPAAMTITCPAPPGHVANADDCDDTDPMVSAAPLWHADADGDGFGDPSTTVTACQPPPGHVANADDCDDANPLVGAAPLWHADADGDGYGDPNTFVQACSAPDGHVDNNFDCDDSDPDILTVLGLYPDADGDGFGDPDGYLESCTLLPGYVENDADCDDTDPLVGDIIQLFYIDADGDGYGDPSSEVWTCMAYPGLVTNGNDCDDTNPALTIKLPYYPDTDGDGFGDAAIPPTLFCSPPSGHSLNNQDCDDTDPALWTGMPCDDGNPLTANDSIGQDCICRGAGVFASIRVKLQGAYIGNGLHRTTLHQQGLMPVQEPYTDLGYDPAPNSVAEGTVMAPEQVPHDQYHRWLDWVVVELRDANDPSVPVTTRYGLLSEIGQILDPLTDGLIRFPVPPGFYHVAVLHRNHQGLVTQEPIDFTVDFVTDYPIVHFDLPSTPVIGGAAARFHDPVSGFAMMRCGDVTFNDDIRYVGNGNDRDPILVRIGGSVPTSTATGYYQEDVTLDGLVKYVGENNDRDPILLSIGGSVPTNVRPNFYLR